MNLCGFCGFRGMNRGRVPSQRIYRFTCAVPPAPSRPNTSQRIDTGDRSVAEGPRVRKPETDRTLKSSRSTLAPSTTPNPTATRSPPCTPCWPARTSTWSSGNHAHVVQPLLRIKEKWVICRLGNNIAAQVTPVEGTRQGLLVRVTFSQDTTGAWTTSDIAWVPSRPGRRSASPLVLADRRRHLRVIGRRRRRPDRHHQGSQPLIGVGARIGVVSRNQVGRPVVEHPGGAAGWRRQPN